MKKIQLDRCVYLYLYIFICICIYMRPRSSFQTRTIPAPSCTGPGPGLIQSVCTRDLVPEIRNFYSLTAAKCGLLSKATWVETGMLSSASCRSCMYICIKSIYMYKNIHIYDICTYIYVYVSKVYMHNAYMIYVQTYVYPIYPCMYMRPRSAFHTELCELRVQIRSPTHQNRIPESGSRSPKHFCTWGWARRA